MDTRHAAFIGFVSAAGTTFLGLALGYLLAPKAWYIETAAAFEAPVPDVYWAISTRDGWRAWTAHLAETHPDIRMEHAPPPHEGVGMVMDWPLGERGREVWTLTEAVPNERVVFRHEVQPQGFVLTDTITIEQGPEGPFVRWIETAELSGNPFARILAGQTTPTVEREIRVNLDRIDEAATRRAEGARALDAPTGETEAPPDAADGREEPAAAESP